MKIKCQSSHCLRPFLEVPFRDVISEAIFGGWNSNGIAELFVGEVVLAQKVDMSAIHSATTRKRWRAKAGTNPTVGRFGSQRYFTPARKQNPPKESPLCLRLKSLVRGHGVRWP